MATPTSHPHPPPHASASKHPAASTHLTPASASASSPPSHTTITTTTTSTTTRSIPSPAYTSTSTAALKTPKTPNRPLQHGSHHRNGSAHVPYSGGTTGVGTPRERGTPRGGAGTGTVSAVDSPAQVVGVGMGIGMERSVSGFGGGSGSGSGNGNGVGMGLGLTPRMGMGMSMGMGTGSGFTPVAMQLTASQGGISAILGAQDQEEERRRRVEGIVGLLGGRWGFVSQEGVERCARRLGLECLWDEGRGDGDGGRTLTVAGTGVIVDVEFRGEVVEGVVLQFEGSRESVKEGAAAGAEVLRRDLRGEGETGYVALDGFVNNLERLATMDRLGGGGVSCFDAVDGLYRSLEKVFSWETGKVKELKIESVEENVLCRQSGRPRLHTTGRVGLSLQYWMERRLLVEKQPGPDAMDVDTATTVNEDEEDEPSIWSAVIECEASSAALYTSIKISNEWVSEAVEKPAPMQNNGLPIDDSPIDWQEPPPTLLAPESPKNQMDVIRDPALTHPKLPDVRFVARFEPPVIVPLQLAIDIHESVGSPLAQESLLPTTYENLLFEDIDTKNQLIPNPRILEKTITTYNPPTASFSTHKHKYTLFTQPQDYARAITTLPFTHPRQILALLPTLRQWALAGSLLRRSFAPATSDTTAPPSHTNGWPPTPTPNPQPTSLSIEAELANFLSTPLTHSLSPNNTTNTPSPHSTRDIQITLTTHPLPRLSLHFPNPRQNGKLASIGFNIGLNGIIDGVDVDDGRAAWRGGGSGGNLEGVGVLRERVRRVLEIGEDAGVGVEWVIGR